MLVHFQVCVKYLILSVLLLEYTCTGNKLILEAQKPTSGSEGELIRGDDSGINTYLEQDVITMEPRPVFVLIGDSITQYSANPYILGFGDLLGFEYTRRVDVINRGLSGYTTEKMLRTNAFDHIMNEVSYFESPALITLFLGTNDAIVPPDPVSVPLKKYVRNMKTMVKTIKNIYKDTSILLICPPPVDDSKFPNRNNHVTGLYADACMTLAAMLKVPSVELYTHMQALPDWKSCFVDGLHFSKRGHQEVFKVIKQKIDTAFPMLQVANIPMQYPQ
ncbi:hypothetical protein SARC_05374 [Sphaeroforma arctica JP610]|uniref:SGNH hydrolase-type esterase domain-containing protein n=1 Tax=Sphaeroforma arctica JP610 TaxID=667725 RepID=A0A0L0FZT0_9EUKA|nr:hypothetical protein SARC_05374 [Sphaeroforma arctica JP610]KNC82335.1 hypothetical protein SARC_05374 [Sphaeroforma arctica JP610]|eukprot:XP_014156237.1 hypothetical protein SARC_05374 [Sphaeroforma arctica JP610]